MSARVDRVNAEQHGYLLAGIVKAQTCLLQFCQTGDRPVVIENRLVLMLRQMLSGRRSSQAILTRQRERGVSIQNVRSLPESDRQIAGIRLPTQPVTFCLTLGFKNATMNGIALVLRHDFAYTARPR